MRWTISYYNQMLIKKMHKNKERISRQFCLYKSRNRKKHTEYVNDETELLGPKMTQAVEMMSKTATSANFQAHEKFHLPSSKRLALIVMTLFPCSRIKLKGSNNSVGMFRFNCNEC